MTVYTLSNRSIESAQPHPRHSQNPPTYSPLPEPLEFEPRQPQGQQEQQEKPEQRQQNEPPPQAGPSKPTVLHKISSKAGWPLNKAANIIGAEGWWPSDMNQECNKAARILHSFTDLKVATAPKANGPMHPTGITRKSMVKIPPAVLQSCAGLAIFSAFRLGGGHSSLSGGSGVVIARRPDRTWSPPSGFVISSLGAGVMFGIGVYDCVCVLNTREQVEAFTRPRLSLGAEGSIAVGPVGTGGHIEAAVSKTGRPMWSYAKSRGLWVGVQIDGTIAVSRSEANALFYKQKGITPRRILREDVAWPMEAKPLFEVLKAVDGRFDYDRTVVQDLLNSPLPSESVVDEKQSEVAPETQTQFYQYNREEEQKKSLEQEQSQEQKLEDKRSEATDNEPKYETAMEEKERLAKSGY